MDFKIIHLGLGSLHRSLVEHRECTDPLAAIIESDHTFQAPHTEPGTKAGDQQVTFLFLLNCLNLHGRHARCGDKMIEYLEKMGISGLG